MVISEFFFVKKASVRWCVVEEMGLHCLLALFCVFLAGLKG